MKNLLQIENLAIGYLNKKQKSVVVKDISVIIKQPKLIGLIGNNGSGKTTLLKTLTKIQPKLSGSILYSNDEINTLENKDIAKNVSIVLTERIPFNNLSVLEVILLGRQIYTDWMGTSTEKDKQIVSDLIHEFHLDDLQDKKTHELSDGQYQKVMIARALAQDTNIILFDEPTSHLDINNKIEVFKIIQKLVKQKNKTIIVSSHEINFLLKVVDDFWVINKQKLYADSKVNCLKNKVFNDLIQSDNVNFNTDTLQYDWS